MGKKCVLLATLAVGLMASPVAAHELWFHLKPGADSAVVRLTFGDTPNLNEAERVAEIAHARSGPAATRWTSSDCRTASRLRCRSSDPLWSARLPTGAS